MAHYFPAKRTSQNGGQGWARHIRRDWHRALCCQASYGILIASLGLLFTAAPTDAQRQTSTTRHVFAWHCPYRGAICIEIQVIQVTQGDGDTSTTLWYRVEDTSKWSIIAGRFFPVLIDNGMFRVAANGKSAILDHPEALVVWWATGDGVVIARNGENGTYRPAAAVGLVATFELDAANRSNATGNPIDGAQLDEIRKRAK